MAWLFIAVQGVLLLAVIALPGPDTPASSALRGIGLVVEIVGMVIILIGAAQLGISLNILPTPNKHGRLRTGGLYRLVRHPIYFGVMVFVVGSALRAPTVARVLAALALGALFHFKAAWEELQLNAKYPDYAEYAARTPPIFPLKLPGRSPDGVPRPR
ncbi:MAG: isoprenylcysteine carboxylmethyltransferase family protein [Acidimicrobiales bacterium]